ncbi:hypothetical protein KFK09_010728 [Dendrobium nobile]|uniref:CCT domain-containing protein n=1 Tax=Dendrobium nobile TaxID=94219 RepID=A0A8T3BGF8_DENNO|nr:hypothetical protein KFK09_010728 [Dendrobium nobile]
MDGIEISFDDEFSLSLDDDNQPYGDLFIKNSKVSSSSGNVAPNKAYCPSLNTTKNAQQAKAGDLKGCLGEITPNLSMDEPKQHEQISAMATATNSIIGNDDQQNNEYNTYSMDDLFELAEALSPHPQQNIINTCMGGLYQGGMSLSACYGGQVHHLFSDAILLMPMPALNSMPTTMLMSVLNKNNQNNTLRPYNMHDTFLSYGYKPTNCRKILADSKPRIRGRFAKNNETEQMARASTSNQIAIMLRYAASRVSLSLPPASTVACERIPLRHCHRPTAAANPLDNFWRQFCIPQSREYQHPAPAPAPATSLRCASRFRCVVRPASRDLLKLPISDFYDDNQPLGDPFFQNSEVYSNVAPNQAYSPSLDATKEEQQTQVGDLKGSLWEIPPNLSIDEPRKHEQIPTMATCTNVIIGNDDQQNDEYTMDELFDLADQALPSHPQQNVTKSIYSDNEPFLPTIPPTMLIGHPNMNTCTGGLYQRGMGLSACYGGQGQTLFSDGNLPKPMPSPNLMPTTMRMPVLKTHYQNNPMRLYNMQDKFRHDGYKPTNLQVLQNGHPQQQRPNNNFSPAVCNDTTSLVPNISNPQTSTLKGVCISAQEKKEKIERYKNKKKRRDFSKKIKYACRKTLADSRPRVKGRFAKTDESEQMARASTSIQDCNNVEAASNNGDLFESFNFLDRSNYNNILEPEYDPLPFYFSMVNSFKN